FDLLRDLAHAQPGHNLNEEGADALQVGHVVHGGGGQGQGHGGVAGGVGVLDDDRAAGVLHVHGARGPVGAGAGEDHGDEVFAVGGRGAGQEQVHRRAWAVGVVSLEVDGAIFDGDVAVGGHDVDIAGEQRGVVVHDDDGQAAAAL